jgi:predicted RNA-binding Zn ribbon-like protein
MYWVEHGDLRLPKRVSGHVALDFVNTWAGWNDGRGGDWLSDYTVLAAWAGYVELLDGDGVARLRRLARRAPTEAGESLLRARTLRTSLHAAALDPSNVRALTTVSSFLRASSEQGRLRPGPDGPARWVLGRGAGLDLPTLLVARHAEQLLTGPDVQLVRACPGEGCGWLFLDRRGRRRWCVMEVCGNRAKARTYAQRHR